VRIGPTAWPFTGFIHTYIHTDRQLDKYILDIIYLSYKTRHLIEEVICTEPSPSLSIPRYPSFGRLLLQLNFKSEYNDLDGRGPYTFDNYG
jgi:hypothetical protein